MTVGLGRGLSPALGRRFVDAELIGEGSSSLYAVAHQGAQLGRG